MDTKKMLTFVFSCLLCLMTTNCQLEESDDWISDKFKEEAAQTFNLVFHKYNHRVRPPQSFIEITISISLRHIRHLEVHKQELQTVLDVEMSWNDTRLQWYPVKVHQISVNTSTVWTPDIVYTNSVAETKVLYPSSVRISNKGFVVWTKKEVVTTLCPTSQDTTIYKCPITLGFMSNSRNDQTDRFFSNVSSFTIHKFKNREWDLVDEELVYDIGNLTSRASSLELNLFLQRQPKGTDGQPTSEHNKEANKSHKTASSQCSDMEEMANKNRNDGSLVALHAMLLPMMWIGILGTHLHCQSLLTR